VYKKTAMNKAERAVIVVTTYLMLFVLMLETGTSVYALPYLLIASPFLLIWMVYFVLNDKREYPKLGENEEWGYRDKAKDELGIF
jgi:hypothetical protein